MQAAAGVITLTPTDLSAFLACRHRTGLDLAVALGLLARPEWTDPFAILLRERGESHERAFGDSLRGEGLEVIDLRDADDRTAGTIEWMRRGAQVIVQGRLDEGQWTGYPDVLRRVERASAFGAWSYEVWDTKLARETRGATILQLSAYSDLLARIQQRLPEFFYVVTPDPRQPVQMYRTDDFAAYYRLVRRQLEGAVAEGPDALQARHYPEPVEECEVCRWRPRCHARRRQDDHLSFIAGASRLHRRELERQAISTLAAVAALPLPLPFEPARGSRAVYERIREQARLQEQRRHTGALAHIVLPVEPEQGLCRLPEPSAGDVFLDLEGDPFVGQAGREYLFGLGRRRDGTFAYERWWAFADADERAAFERTVDAIVAAWNADPNMHVYHFGHYEPSALKRLMGRYATREAEVDRLLRGERFVDLLSVVRHSVRAAVESYSIKELEAFYGFTRDLPLDEASRNRRIVELALKLQDKTSLGTLEVLDRLNSTIDVKQGPSKAHLRPAAVFAHDAFSPDVMQESVLRLAEALLERGFAERGAAVDLLLRRTPRLRSAAFAPNADESAVDFAVRVAGDLDRTILAIQGPPGAGKTYTGARMIRRLVAAGRRAGITAVSHKVIDNLLAEVLSDDADRIRAVHRVDEDAQVPDGVEAIDDYDEIFQRLATGEANVVGGTAWLWSRPGAAGTVDVLFVDEAGQMSLATALACCQAADSVVLLGDPQQLEQPQKASHPDGTDISALEHVLAGAKTMPPERGIFLPHTWRLPPAICGFTSELFYEGRLASVAGMEQQRLSGTDGFDGSGLWCIDVEHEGNQNWSAEEVDVVSTVVRRLLRPAATWTHYARGSRPLTAGDVVVVAPYNAHVNRLHEALSGHGVQVGTVDRFQGQDRAVVIYSMAASSVEDAPRGMEFLYRLNRLNVASSRARCAAILVASRQLFEPECRTPQQMRLANALCRSRELSQRQ